MATTESGVATAFADALVAQDFAGAVALLHPEVDFKAMTPNRFWEPADRAAVAEVFRLWYQDPDEEVHAVEATEPVSIEDTVRVGWRVRISDADGLHVFEQQAYVRERDGRIAWMRVICSGWILLGEPAA